MGNAPRLLLSCSLIGHALRVRSRERVISWYPRVGGGSAVMHYTTALLVDMNDKVTQHTSQGSYFFKRQLAKYLNLR